jgi:NADH-quinone oxidoreductase subunit E
VSQENIQFPEPLLQEVAREIAKFPEGKQKSALLSVLHIAQAHFGYLSEPVMDYVARLLHILPIEVYEVATFYSMYDTKPVGKVKLEVCRTGPCMIEGAENCRMLGCLRIRTDAPSRRKIPRTPHRGQSG